jgi:hypothetical protein
MLAATFETASLLILRAFFAFGTGVSTGHISIFMSLYFTFDPLPETCGFSHEGGLRSWGSGFQVLKPIEYRNSVHVTPPSLAQTKAVLGPRVG